MKRWQYRLPLCIALAFAIGGISCGPRAQMNPDFVRAAANRSDPRIVIIRTSDNPLYEGPIKWFIDTTAGEVSVFTYKSGKEDGLASSIRKVSPRLVFTLGAQATAFARGNFPDVPLVFAMVVNYRRLKMGDAVAGVALEPTPTNEFSQFKMILPGMKKILAFHSPASAEIVGRSRDELKQLGIELLTIEVKKPDDVQAAFPKNVTGIDAIWQVNDPVVVTEKVFNFLRDRSNQLKIPFLASLSEEFAQAGAMAAVSVDFTSLGAQAATIAREILSGKSPKQVGVQAPIGAYLALNLDVAEQINAQVPAEALANVNKVFSKAAKAAQQQQQAIVATTQPPVDEKAAKEAEEARKQEEALKAEAAKKDETLKAEAAKKEEDARKKEEDARTKEDDARKKEEEELRKKEEALKLATAKGNAKKKQELAKQKVELAKQKEELAKKKEEQAKKEAQAKKENEEREKAAAIAATTKPPQETPGAKTGPRLVVFYDPDANPEVILQVSSWFTKFLQSIDPDLKLQPVRSVGAFEQLKAKGLVSFAILPSSYVRANLKGGTIVPLLLPSAKGSVFYQKVLFAKTKDAKPKTLAVTAAGASTKDLAKALADAGIPMDGVTVIPVSKDVDALLALVFGQVDAAVVKVESLEVVKAIQPAAAATLQKLRETKPITRPPFVALSGVSSEEQAKVVAAMKTMNKNPSGARAMRSLGVDAWTAFDASMLH
jgi:ABC-type uncharacterized transport system substrate-binding protein